MKGWKRMQEEKVLLDATLCFPIKGDEVLLGRKMKKIGAGCRNGYGGGIEDGETSRRSIIRELETESGGVKALPNALDKVAEIYFRNTKTDGDTFTCKVHVYFLYRWEGDFQSTDEVSDPTWFKKQELPLDEMMPADREWLPIVLSGRKIIGKASYGPFQQSLLEPVKIQYVDSFPY